MQTQPLTLKSFFPPLNPQVEQVWEVGSQRLITRIAPGYQTYI
jgi:hypothetical protein